jgi:transposase
MDGLLPQSVVDSFRRTAKSLSGYARRVFQAVITAEHADGNPRKAETLFGWNRRTVRRALFEKHIDREIRSISSSKGRPRVEALNKDLLPTAKKLLEEKSQVDPKFQSSKIFTRITGNLFRKALAEQLQIDPIDLPSPRTNRRMLNRNGYSLRPVRKVLPIKKIPQTDAIFSNVQSAHLRAANDSSILRISIDAKATVKLGPFSRGGRTRNETDAKAADHDMGGKSVTPCGILEIGSNQLFIEFVSGPCTSDTFADQLNDWWELRKEIHPDVKTIMIDLDNGPQISSHRTQFMARMIEFADNQNLIIELVYYPPYHSKYNRIERCWSALERHWNGTQLCTLNKAVGWAKTMTWNALSPIVGVAIKVYAKGVKLTKKAFAKLASRLERTIGIEGWSVRIVPHLCI